MWPIYICPNHLICQLYLVGSLSAASAKILVKLPRYAGTLHLLQTPSHSRRLVCASAAPKSPPRATGCHRCAKSRCHWNLMVGTCAHWNRSGHAVMGQSQMVRTPATDCHQSPIPRGMSSFPQRRMTARCHPLAADYIGSPAPARDFHQCQVQKCNSCCLR